MVRKVMRCFALTSDAVTCELYKGMGSNLWLKTDFMSLCYSQRFLVGNPWALLLFLSKLFDDQLNELPQSVIIVFRRAGHRGTGTVGITCMAIGNDLLSGGLASKRVFSTNNLLAVGCESGAVLKCNIEAVELNPVIFTYEVTV